MSDEYKYKTIYIEGKTYPDANQKSMYTFVKWEYPEIYDRENQSILEIGLVHTRASDNIRVKYDSERNGWVIEQQDSYNNKTGESTWKEVFFAESYALFEE